MSITRVEDIASSQASALTKREYIATMALQGILANSYNDASYEGAARDAVVHADALLEALAKPARPTTQAEVQAFAEAEIEALS